MVSQVLPLTSAGAQFQVGYISVNTNHLYNICTMLSQRQRRWADVVQMLYKFFVFVGMFPLYFTNM